ncbi:hypothetical protein GCM10010924_48110 [Rhizobium wenxiniae]|uniref:Uncharacterized protein n=1 Tax=Rhizobium wenxiniae TaxID=1737357 RepID=A0A7W9YAY1_9HYPH|nr:hypothetical protein [Rhizobium wenxiniae]GGG13313.1 hypothetical protein GCM10010924_48110 [Rhizobium wenxiniae]
MQANPELFPTVFYPSDIRAMAAAYRVAVTRPICADVDPVFLARAVLHFYGRGLVDPDRLSELTCSLVGKRRDEGREAHRTSTPKASGLAQPGSLPVKDGATRGGGSNGS